MTPFLLASRPREKNKLEGHRQRANIRLFHIEIHHSFLDMIVIKCNDSAET